MTELDMEELKLLQPVDGFGTQPPQERLQPLEDRWCNRGLSLTLQVIHTLSVNKHANREVERWAGQAGWLTGQNSFDL